MAGDGRRKAPKAKSVTPTSFYTAVYRLVARIPPGKVATYGQIARLLGHPSAARAVGYALHALPTSSDIPWQRVINAAGRISSRCHSHAESIQRALLEAEGVRFNAADAVDLRRYRWPGPSADEAGPDYEMIEQQRADQRAVASVLPIRRRLSPTRRLRQDEAIPPSCLSIGVDNLPNGR